MLAIDNPAETPPTVLLAATAIWIAALVFQAIHDWKTRRIHGPTGWVAPPVVAVLLLIDQPAAATTALILAIFIALLVTAMWLVSPRTNWVIGHGDIFLLALAPLLPVHLHEPLSLVVLATITALAHVPITKYRRTIDNLEGTPFGPALAIGSLLTLLVIPLAQNTGMA